MMDPTKFLLLGRLRSLPDHARVWFSSNARVERVLDVLATEGHRVVVALGSYNGVKEVSYDTTNAALQFLVKEHWLLICDQESILTMSGTTGRLLYISDPSRDTTIGHARWTDGLPTDEQAFTYYTDDDVALTFKE